MFDEIEKVKMPIIYISLALILSTICYGIYDKYLWLAVLIAGLFFIFLFFASNIYFTIVIIIFFILGGLINYNYYNLKLNDNVSGSAVIIEKKNKIICEYKGRNFYFDDTLSKYNVHDKFYFEGRFTENIDKEKGIIGTINVDQYKKLDKDLLGKIYQIRQQVFDELSENIGQRKAGFVSALSFGYTEYLDSEDQKEMKNLGIIHAISVSGLHIVLIFSIVNKILGKTASIGIMIVYVIFTGIAFSAIRALIMMGLLVFSNKANKKYSRIASLAISAAIIVVIKPYSIFDIGFILSYLATLGIVLFSKEINNRLYRLPKYIRETIAVGISAQIFTLPIIISVFNEVSLTVILGNLIVVPILNILIILGNLLLPFCLVPEIFDLISYILLKIIDFNDSIINYLYTISSKTYVTNKSTALIYGLILISIYYISKGYKKFIMLPFIASIVIMIYIYSPVPRVDYLKEGGILISYNGDRKVITNKINLDLKKIKSKTLSKAEYKLAKQIIIDDIKITEYHNNYIMELGKKEYLLRLTQIEEKSKNYDIINFENGYTKGFFIIGDKILTF
jgi:competence protein ComEC